MARDTCTATHVLTTSSASRQEGRAVSDMSHDMLVFQFTNLQAENSVYPQTLNTDIPWLEEVRPCRLPKREHDVYMLDVMRTDAGE